MVELSNERVEQILNEETVKTEELKTILRGIYTRYMRLFEKYLSDIDALNDDEIEKLKNYHEETRSLVKYYYLDIPLDTCILISEFEDEYSCKMLGADWHEFIFGKYKEFKDKNRDGKKSEEVLKAEFEEKTLESFYDAMDYVFRDSFGTESKTASETADGIAGLLFGE